MAKWMEPAVQCRCHKTMIPVLAVLRRRVPAAALLSAFFLLSSCIVAFQTTNGEAAIKPDEEKDVYAIYSMLLRAEMRPVRDVSGWVIQQKTRDYPGFAREISHRAFCLQPAKPQESTYRSLIDDYIRKNKHPQKLERHFDLPQYVLLDTEGVEAFRARHWNVLSSEPIPEPDDRVPFKASTLFEVSAVGFNSDRTRALVYVGHQCGGLCGGGIFHLLMKQNGRWTHDSDYRGSVCSWVS
jgi:hypothetical protein